MPRWRRVGGVVVVAALAGAAGLAAGGLRSPAWAAAGPRWVTLAGSAVPFTRTSRIEGAVPGSQRVLVQVWLTPRDTAAATRYAMAVSTPGNRLFHHYLRPGAFTARFGATSGEVAAVTSWLRGAGFADVTAGAQRSYVRAAGRASVVNAAFGVRLTRYAATAQVNAGPYPLHANNRAVRVPAALASSVLAITGLSNAAPIQSLARAPRAPAGRRLRCSHYYGQRRVSGLPRQFGVTSFPTGICDYTAGQLRKAYGANMVNTGKGQAIAFTALGLSRDMFLTLHDYAKASHLPAPARSRYSQVSVDGSAVHCGDPFYGEEQMDVEVAYDMAPGASEIVVSSCNQLNYGAQGLLDDLMRILAGAHDRPLASVASNSWISGREGQPSSLTKTEHMILVRAAAEGVGMYFSAGDEPYLYEPAADPFAIAVGGTNLGIGRGGRRLFESGWSSGGAAIDKHHWTPARVVGGTGGGPSEVWAEPAYQKGVVPASLTKRPDHRGPGRSVPDISADASDVTAMAVGLLAFSRKPGVPPRLYEVQGGGTSQAAPTVAGMVIDAQQGQTTPFGFLNPVLYKLAGTSALHDILPVTRRTPALFRAVLCNSTSLPCVASNAGSGDVLNVFDQQNPLLGAHLVTLKGYDNMTGVGSPNGQDFIRALRNHDK